MPLNVRTYTDFNPDFIINPVTNDVPVLRGNDAIMQSVENLLFTNYHEVPFHPEIGCNIRNLLFEQISPHTTSLLQRHIEQTIENFEPRVTIDQLDVTPDYKNSGYTIDMTYFIENVTTPVTISTFLEKVR